MLLMVTICGARTEIFTADGFVVVIAGFVTFVPSSIVVVTIVVVIVVVVGAATVISMEITVLLIYAAITAFPSETAVTKPVLSTVATSG